MCSGSDCSYTLDNDRCVSRVSLVHDQLEAPEEVTCALGVGY